MNGAFVPAFPGWPDGSWSDLASSSLSDVWLLGQSGRAHFRCGTWSIEPPPTTLYVVGAVGTADAWGLRERLTAPYFMQLVHWDGTSWSPAPGALDDFPLKATVSGPQVWTLGGPDSTLIVRREAGEWASFQAPEPVTDLAAVAANDLWLVGKKSVWRGDGATWTRVGDSPPPLILPVPSPSSINRISFVTAGPDAIWLRDDFSLSRWDGQSFQPEDPTAFCPELLFRAPDDTLVAAGVDELPAPGEDLFSVRSLRRRQGDGWSPPLVAPANLGPVSALWARAADDIWLWADDAPGIDAGGRVIHLKNNTFTEFSLHGGAWASRIWGDEQGTYVGTGSGAIWKFPFPD
jgi:hypothetical protein